MLVSPLRNQSSSCTIAFNGSRLVVSIGKPAERLKRIWWPKIDNVPVPVRSCFSAPSARIRSSRSWYWFMASHLFEDGEVSGRRKQSTAPIRSLKDYTRKNDDRFAERQGAEPWSRPS